MKCRSAEQHSKPHFRAICERDMDGFFDPSNEDGRLYHIASLSKSVRAADGSALNKFCLTLDSGGRCFLKRVNFKR